MQLIYGGGNTRKTVASSLSNLENHESKKTRRFFPGFG